MPLGGEVGRQGHVVLDRAPAPFTFPQKGHSSPPTCRHCGQMAGWIKVPLGTEAGIGPGDMVLDGDPAPPMERGRATPHTFRPTLLWYGRLSQQLLSSC